MGDFDEFENFIRHSDFGKILELAASLQTQKKQLVTLAKQGKGASSTSSPSLSLRARKKKKADPNQYTIPDSLQDGNVPREERPHSRHGGRQQPNSFDGAARLIRTTLIPPAKEDSDPMADMTRRGECLITDSLIDETIRSLADELKLCLDLKKQLRQSRLQQSEMKMSVTQDNRNMSMAPPPYMNDRSMKVAPPPYMMPPGVANKVSWTGAGGSKMDTSVEDNAPQIASKFSKWQTDILTDWMIENREHPFPTHEQIAELANATHLTDTQVVNWTTNTRKRNMKATVEHGKKPHHFLDYLFLATDREKKMREEHPDMDFTFLDNPAAMRGNNFHPPPAPQQPNHVPSNYAHYAVPQPPDIHHRRAVVPPRAPRNTDNIFRPSRSPNDAQFEQARERERMMLHDYDAQQDFSPRGSFDGENGEDGKLHMDDIDQDMFDATEQKTLSSQRDKSPKAVSFDPDAAPFDENAEDYLMRLLSA